MQKLSDLDSWLAWQETLNPQEIDLKLERVAEVYRRLDLPRPQTLISVAGTNGKGSTVALLDALLAAAGRRVGAYTSPHLQHYNERIRVAGQDADDAAIVAAFERIESLRGDIALTYFEYGTLAALQVFADSGADTVILEVGLGGRLDAVNALDPDAVVITPIDVDHINWLGADRETIGREKAGIMRAGRPAICTDRDVPDSIPAYAASIGASLHLIGRDFDAEREGRLWHFRSEESEIGQLPLPGIPGEHQIDNAAGALAVLQALAIDEALEPRRLAGALKTARLRGRQHLIPGAPDVLFDVAHNLHAVRALVGSLPTGRYSEITVVIGMLTDKPLSKIAHCLAPVADRWATVPTGGSRAQSADVSGQIISAAVNAPVEVHASIEAGLRRALASTATDGLVIVIGSFQVVGPALELYSRLQEQSV